MTLLSGSQRIQTLSLNLSQSSRKSTPVTTSFLLVPSVLHTLHCLTKAVSVLFFYYSLSLSFIEHYSNQFLLHSIVDRNEDMAEIRLGGLHSDLDSEEEREFNMEYRFCKGEAVIDFIEPTKGELTEMILDEDGKTFMRTI